ncbi:uncharacterized protein Z520_02693 [Fonsecaea multimorphosa CBS 102226]|uniref:Uncharacterized protein n=1 Tax=Fonsecaea multimorphosa CBS 102226 TaxID=1442371 RepID=A0A0D2HGU3_9EURO|nr:uncharacterized protein Z520_02693 [Fonsecaea multimorphosa CBS 102226]KIY01141.1 hypothetical protein Z520_02693 [Fonsecaea multimorphosa CBS 102226]OAL28760.1 hypothetical protein AYO22_02625 [Fonsecaea multimorphosa]
MKIAVWGTAVAATIGVCHSQTWDDSHDLDDAVTTTITNTHYVCPCATGFATAPWNSYPTSYTSGEAELQWQNTAPPQGPHAAYPTSIRSVWIDWSPNGSLVAWFFLLAFKQSWETLLYILCAIVDKYKLFKYKLSNHKLSNHQLSNHQLSNHKLFNHKLFGHKLFDHKLFNHKLFNRIHNYNRNVILYDNHYYHDYYYNCYYNDHPHHDYYNNNDLQLHNKSSTLMRERRLCLQS